MGPSAPVAACRNAVRADLRDLVGAPGVVVLVAVSGGSDSLALLAATCFVAPRMGIRVGAVSVDHGLQPGSAERARLVAAHAARAGADPVSVVHVVVDSSGGPEAAARRARYDALTAAATAAGADAVLLGHTRDDQAETVLLGLARGSGARSLSGMAAAVGIFRRPLLALPRSTLAAAAEHVPGLRPWDDPHNHDPAYGRPRVRHRVLPVLERELGPGIAPALARTADLLRDDADALDEWAEGEARRLVEEADGQVRVDAVGVSGLPRAVRTRVLRRAALRAGAPACDLTAGHVRALDGVVMGGNEGMSVDLPGRARATRIGGRLLVVRG